MMLGTIAQAGNDVARQIDTPPGGRRANAASRILSGGAVLILAWASMTRRGERSSLFAVVTIVTALASMASAVPLWRDVTDAHHGPYPPPKEPGPIDGVSGSF